MEFHWRNWNQRRDDHNKLQRSEGKPYTYTLINTYLYSNANVYAYCHCDIHTDGDGHSNCDSYSDANTNASCADGIERYQPD